MSARSHRPRLRVLLAGAALLASAAALPAARPAASTPSAPSLLHHSLDVRLDPAAHRLDVTDRLVFPPGVTGEADFLLNAKLSVTASSPAVHEVPLGDVGPFLGINAGDEESAPPPLKRYRVRPGDGDREVSVTYGGPFDFGLSDQKEEYTRGFRETTGAIGPEGVYLAGNGFWYPYAGRDLFTFDVAVTSPEGWRVVSQGKGTSRGDDGVARWESEGPMDEVVLAGGPLMRWDDEAGPVVTEVFLHEKDDALAGKYLTAAGQYLTMYADLIGPYPYAKFALVENFWETGYGMPSFTLLGPQVIRFPFILHSSYPHEILHNWWGNSVFVDYDSGNWCEGLTAYMADHLVQEQRGKGDESRRATLQKYRDYVAKGRDFPLTEFRSRHSAVTEAVGYGKTMMGFHMLRRRLGDDVFRKWAARFYAEERGRRASFADVRATMEDVSGQDLGGFFQAWVDRPGAPALAIAQTRVEPAEGGYTVRGVLRQTQEGPPWPIDVPLAVQTSGATVVASAGMDGREAAFAVAVPAPPLALHVDPAFDLFRRLDARETPPSIGQIFGEPRILAVLPAGASENERRAYRALVEGWRSDSHDPQFATDAEVTELPSDRAVWILGGGNRLASKVAFPVSEGALTATELKAGGETMPRAGHSFVLTARHPADPARSVGWIVADPLDALPGLGRKLPHYGKYSYLGFEGDEPVNVIKGQWSAADSPLVVDLRSAGERAASLPALKLPARQAMAELPPVFSEKRMRETVAWLAAPEREGRGIGTAGLDAAAERIASEFAAIGLAPGGDGGGYMQRFETEATPDGKPRQVANVIGILPGSRPEWTQQSVVVGAHYDHLGYGWPDPHAGDEGKVHPGADDNASGVAVMLELAHAMADGERPQRTVIFVAFTGEEEGLVGSRWYVEHPARPIDKVIGMIALDTVGRLGSKKVSVLASGTATEWQHIFRGASYVTGVDSRLIPESYESSDQKSFIDRGVPAVQIFTEPHADYHRPGDTPDRIDFDGMMKVASFTMEGVAYLGERPEPLTVTIAGAGTPAAAPHPGGEAGGGRRVSVGTVPDFGFEGPGVRVSSVVPGSPAEAAGFREGDVLLRLAGRAIDSLKGYSEVLKTLEPGATVEAVVLRDGAEATLSVTLTAR